MNDLIDGNPNWERVQELADTFYILYMALPEAVLNMKFPASPSELHSCGTPACHAGWFSFCNGTKANSSFLKGADSMARHLGFSSKEILEFWAKTRMDIWGNGEREMMFYTNEAFGKESYDTITLKDIYLHWQKVANRLGGIQNV